MTKLSLTVLEAMLCKRAAEQKIFQAIAEFSEWTGLRIESLELHEACELSGRRVLVGVAAIVQLEE